MCVSPLVWSNRKINRREKKERMTRQGKHADLQIIYSNKGCDKRENTCRKQISFYVIGHLVIARVISKCSGGQRTAGAFIEILEGDPEKNSFPSRTELSGTSHLRNELGCVGRYCNLANYKNKRNFAIGKDEADERSVFENSKKEL